MTTAPDAANGNDHLKQQLRQLESIAALSGGIAHDYNNLLTAIMGNISLALEHVEPAAKVTDWLEQALAASRSAQLLTRTLITFSKGGVPTKKPTNIVQVVKNTATFSLSGSNIRCAIEPGEDTWRAHADAQQIGQAIHNLMINAAESMPAGGTVSIRFENLRIDGTNTILAPGRYVQIAIRDHGVGIPGENIDKIFDPYFSTKAKGSGKGTGLGLSISHSIITKHGGEITVRSRPGTGSTFYVLLPASEDRIEALPQPPAPAPTPAPAPKVVSGQGKILVMDDEAMIRELAGNILGHLGYSVDFAEEGQVALDKYQAALASDAPFDAVILDLTIKGGMGGEETIKRLLAIDPDVRAIVSSGYSDNPVLAHYKDYGFCAVVAKPYEVTEFSRQLDRVIRSGLIES